MKTFAPALAATLAFGSIACSSGDDSAPETTEPTPFADLVPDDVMTDVNGTIPCDYYESGFAGDELCIKPPEPGTGAHLHVGPTDYDDPDQIAEFIVEPGDEPTEYYWFNTPNDEVINFYKQHYRMRPGSHHLIIHQERRPTEQAGWIADRPERGSDSFQIGGTQRSAADFPPGGVIPPEDADLARPLGPGVGMAFEMHFVNATDEPILREAWVNFMAIDREDFRTMGGLFLIGGGFEVPPGASQTLNYTTAPVEDERRMISIFGHRHANTDRFTVWAHQSGERNLVYEDYDWAEPAELMYNTVHQNPTPNRDTLRAGGHSGMVELHPGDFVEWECEVHNRQDVPLTVGNEVYTAEMCNLFGTGMTEKSLIWFERPELVIK